MERSQRGKLRTRSSDSFDERFDRSGLNTQSVSAEWTRRPSIIFWFSPSAQFTNVPISFFGDRIRRFSSD
jgi:hypothetical protein